MVLRRRTKRVVRGRKMPLEVLSFARLVIRSFWKKIYHFITTKTKTTTTTPIVRPSLPVWFSPRGGVKSIDFIWFLRFFSSSPFIPHPLSPPHSHHTYDASSERRHGAFFWNIQILSVFLFFGESLTGATKLWSPGQGQKNRHVYYDDEMIFGVGKSLTDDQKTRDVTITSSRFLL